MTLSHSANSLVARWIFRLLTVVAACGLFELIPNVQAQAPQILSVTPTNGATGVGATDPLIIVFDQDMDTSVAVFASPPPAVGSFAVEPASLGQQLFGVWDLEGKRTLTFTPLTTIPLNITVTWTLNPPGVLSFFQIKSASGEPLATVSGSYSTGSGAPALGSVAPTNNAVNVPTNMTVVFRFTQPMQKTTIPASEPSAVLWSGTGIDPTKFHYTWSADGRSLNADYAGGFPRSTQVSWVLNPASAPEKLQSEGGDPLPVDAYQGTFTTAAFTPCNMSPLPPTWGSYGLVERANYVQESAAGPEEDIDSEASSIFSVLVNSPAFGPVVTGGSLEFPDGSITNLTPIINVLQFFESFATEAEMNAAYPPGNYTIRFTQTGQAEQVKPMTFAATDVPPAPKITNFDAAQSLNAGQAFTLQWEPFANADADDFISMFISDDEGHIFFQAPDLCVPIPLPPTSTSIVIPANTLPNNREFRAEVLFGGLFYFDTNSVPNMWGYGNIIRSTRFTMKTGSSNPGQPPVLSSVRILPSGAVAFDLTGTPGQTFGIQRTSQLNSATWPEVGTVTANASGTATYEDPPPQGSDPGYYRAVPK